MEKIIGGKKINNQFPVRIHEKILWPCYEFIAGATGIDNYGKNIIEEVVLRLADINITDIKEIASCTGLEEDLISFIQSRLEQRECLDNCYHITETGREKLGEFSEKHSKAIHIYVDAVSGRIIPYYSMIDDDNSFKYSYGKEDGDIFMYKGFSTAGTETDEMQTAYKLHYLGNFNHVPESDDISAMLHKLFPKKDGIFVSIDKSQNTKKNLRWFLLDLFQPEGSSRDWIFTDGFGQITSFFSVSHIDNDDDNRFISSLRAKTQIQTNEQEKALVVTDRKYPSLQQKLNNAQRSMKELQMIVDSPDKEEELRSAMIDSCLFLTQLAEWVLYYILHEGNSEYKARNALSSLEKFQNKKSSDHIISGIAKRCAFTLGFECGTDEKKSLVQRYGKLWYAFNKVPALFALLDILLIGLEQEPWLKKFAKEHSDFLTVLTSLNISRNQTFHSGAVGESKAFVEQTEKAYREILAFMKAGLGIEVNESKKLSFAEKVALQNERDEAISRMEQSLGFALCRTLDGNLIRFVTDMERRGTDAALLSNAIILDQYKILEHMFVSANERLGNEWKSSDWKAKVRSAGFELAKTKDFKAFLGTNAARINSALERKPASMNATCIAFCTLADVNLLKDIAMQWKTMLKDVSYVTEKRAHGEIPAKIDPALALEIKRHLIGLIKFFAENEFFLEKSVNLY